MDKIPKIDYLWKNIMNKNKNNLIVIALIIIIIVLLGICIFFAAKMSDLNSSSKNTGKIGDIINLKETSMKLPNFKIEVRGAFSGAITDEFLEEDKIKIYEFDTTVDLGLDKTSTNHYVGVKIKDLFEYYQLDGFTTVEFESIDTITVKYIKSGLLTDNSYLVFYRDGKLIDDEVAPALLTVDIDYRYSLERVVRMDFAYLDSSQK